METSHKHQGLGVSQEALVAAAGAALYGAKQAGRNQRLVSLPLTPEPQDRNDVGAVSIVVDGRRVG